MTNPNKTLAELAIAIFQELDRFDEVFAQLPQLVAGIFQQHDDAKEMKVTPTVINATSARISFVLIDTNNNMGAATLGLEFNEDGLRCYGHNPSISISTPLKTPDDLAKVAIIIYENAATELAQEQKNKRPKRTITFSN
jgi:hypothetical protein